VAIVTDSASDLPAAVAGAAGITVAPLIVSFGQQDYLAGVDMTPEQFWERMTAPGAPLPKTAATSMGVFRETFERLFAGGADAIVCIDIARTLSATVESAQLARDALPDREIHVIDTESASMIQGILALMASEMSAAGASAVEIAAYLRSRLPDTKFYVALETLDYLRRGGRISGPRAAVGTVLSVKPIATIENGLVVQVDQVRTRGRARQRIVELIGQRPVERLAILHARTPDIESFADDVAAATGLPRSSISIQLIGASIGPHVGPGAYGAAILYRPS